MKLNKPNPLPVEKPNKPNKPKLVNLAYSVGSPL
ncbi:hypothetical protein ES708_21190 [subsurface metagenome]